MYGYEEHVEITPEQLLQKVSREQILTFVLGQPFDINKKYRSIFRDDSHPNCRFERRPDGAIIFIDFGEKVRTGRTHRSVFGMVMEKYNVSLMTAISIICNHFGLSVSAKDYLPVDTTGNFSSDVEATPSVIIKYDEKEPDKTDTWYWSQFLIRLGDLKEDNVFCAKRFSIRNNRGVQVFTPYKYCYVFDFLSTKKVYQPYNESMKFVSNCDADVIGNFDNLPSHGDELIVQKSYKDHRVLRNLMMGLNVIWFQNEGCVPSIEILKNLTDRFKLITIFFDNDEHGILASIKLAEIFNSIRPGCARAKYLPEHLGKERKDPAAFINKEGRHDLIQVLNHIGIYGNAA